MGWFFGGSKKQGNSSGLQKGEYNSRCFGCSHYDGRNKRGDITSVVCKLTNEVKNGVVGCGSFSPDQSAGCTGCAFKNEVSCAKDLIPRFGWKDGYCNGFEKKNYYKID